MAADEASTKRCTRCSETKPLGDFGINRAIADGRAIYCRPCHRAIGAERRAKNPGQDAARMAAYRAANHDKLRERENAQRRAKTAERLAANAPPAGMKRCARCDEVHPHAQFGVRPTSKDGLHPWCRACRADEHRAYYAANREAVRAKNAAWQASKPEQYRAAIYRWRRANPEKIRPMTRAYRARKNGAAGRHTQHDIAEIRKAQRDRCGYCRVGLRGGGVVDHIRPLALGGRNDRRNLQLLCQPCNSRKSSKDPLVFAQSRGLLL